MSKSINIFLGSVGNLLNDNKQIINELNRSYLTNLRIINTRQYLCAELIKSKDILEVNYSNIKKVLIALTNEEYWNNLINIYYEYKDISNNLEEDILNKFNELYLNNMLDAGYDVESIYILVYLFIKIMQFGGDSSVIYQILESEYEFINRKEAENRSLLERINSYNNNLNNISVIIDTNLGSITIKSILSKLTSLSNSINNAIQSIQNKNSNNMNIDLNNENDLYENQNDGWVLDVSCRFNKREIKEGESAELIYDYIKFHNNYTNEEINLIPYSNLFYCKGFIIEEQYSNICDISQYYLSRPKIIGKHTNVLTSINIKAKFGFLYQGKEINTICNINGGIYIKPN